MIAHINCVSLLATIGGSFVNFVEANIVENDAVVYFSGPDLMPNSFSLPPCTEIALVPDPKTSLFRRDPINGIGLGHRLTMSSVDDYNTL